MEVPLARPNTLGAGFAHSIPLPTQSCTTHCNYGSVEIVEIVLNHKPPMEAAVSAVLHLGVGKCANTTGALPDSEVPRSMYGMRCMLRMWHKSACVL